MWRRGGIKSSQLPEAPSGDYDAEAKQMSIYPEGRFLPNYFHQDISNLKSQIFRLKGKLTPIYIMNMMT